MPRFRNAVPTAQRERSRWFAEIACYVTPEGLAWRYTDDPQGLGVSWRGSDGSPIAAAQVVGWLTDDERAELSRGDRPLHGTAFDPERS